MNEGSGQQRKLVPFSHDALCWGETYHSHCLAVTSCFGAALFQDGISGIYRETCGNRVSGKVDGGTLSFVHLSGVFIRFAMAIVSRIICLET